MKTINIVCPECLKDRLTKAGQKDKELICMSCDTIFVHLGGNKIKYKE